MQVGGRDVEVKNLDKVLFPATGFTKGDLIEYYREVSEALLPHLQGRPLSMRRFPEGVGEEGFWEKRCPSHRPDWVRTVRVPRSDGGGEEIEFCSVDDLPTLIWAADLADIELHVTLARGEAIERPTALAFDLDPGAPAGVLDCARVAMVLRDLLAGLGLDSYAKTSGSKGMQVYVPLNAGDVTYEQTKPFAKAVARAFEHRCPERVVSRMRRDLREGRVLIDWSQNDAHKTTVCVYSVRATERPRASAPLRWEEVERACEERDAHLLDYTPSEVLGRMRDHGDLFAPVLETRQELPSPESISASQ